VASEEHLQIIRQGVEIWNAWRRKNPEAIPDLSGANLAGANLIGADLRGADLRRAKFSLAYLDEVDLSEANLSGAFFDNATLRNANLRKANLNGAILIGAILAGANLSGANLAVANLFCAVLCGANLSRADLQYSNLVMADLRDADLTGCYVFGTSVWELKSSKETKQQNLVITVAPPAITVDNINVAQFIYLLLKNEEIRNVIDTITSKAVLILGRFSEERKRVLDAIRDELRNHNYLPIMFDFDPTTNQRIDETVRTLAGMSRFVIADLTDARSVPQELQIIDAHCRTVAVRLIKKRGAREYGMLDFRNSPWFVSGKYEYESLEELLASIKENVIEPAEAKVKELRQGHN
jgi:hypothetical protein